MAKNQKIKQSDTCKQQTCRQCGESKPADAEHFVPGTKGRLTKLCRACRTANESERRTNARNTAAIDLSSYNYIIDEPKKKTKTSLAFDSREKLSDTLKDELSESLKEIKDNISFNKFRLQQAIMSGSSKQIDEANKALQKAQAEKAQIVLTINERLKLMEELRVKAEKAKPVSFIINELPTGVPTIVPNYQESNGD